MNELQIKLTGDISALQSALTKAKATIKSFEESTAKESERGNVGFKRKIGLIESLTNKSKALRTALSQATNENDVARYNQELEQTIKEMSRLNALGRQVQNNIGATSQGFKGAAQNIGSANGVAIEFNRIIQDAPFGLIGIGNNLQQLTANFAQTSKAAGGAGAAIKASLGALISPANLLVLGISAITAAFTAYQMGAFDFLKSNEDAKEGLEEVKSSADIYKESLDKLIRSLNSVDSARIKGNQSAAKELSSLELLKGVIEDESKSRKTRLAAINEVAKISPGLITSLDKERILVEGLAKEYGLLTAAIIERATASAIEENIGDLAVERVKLIQKENSETTYQNSLIDQQNKLNEKKAAALKTINDAQSTQIERNKALRSFSEADSGLNKLTTELETYGIVASQTDIELKKNQASTDSLKEAYSGLNQELISLITNTDEPIVINPKDKLELSDIFNLDPADFKGQLDMINRAITEGLITAKEAKEIQDSFAASLNFSSAENIEKIANSLGVTIEQAMALLAENEIIEVPINIGFGDEQKEKILESNNILADSFASLGLGIASSMNIGNDSLKGFIMTLISSTPKIIAAMRQASAAKSAAAAKDIATNTQVATSEGVSVATKAANALGPVGLALLPVFIGGVLALISSGMKGGSGGGGGFAGGGGASSGKAPQIFTNKVSPPSSSSPNLNSGSIDQANAQSRLFVDVSGDNLRFILDRANERASNG